MRMNGPLTPGKAVFRGHMMATVPALLLLVAVFVVCEHWIAQPLLWPQHSFRAYFMRLGMVSVGALALGWLWWSVAILRWLLWARSRGADEKETQRLARRTLLLCPKGSWVQKT